MNTLGDRLRYLRERDELTQTDLIQLFKKRNFNITNAAISQYENNKRIPDTQTLAIYADIFNVSIDWLYGRSTDVKDKTIENKNLLTLKDEKEIEKRIAKLRQDLTSEEGFMLSGEPASQEAIESILEALEFGIRQAKIINKKYTPKKYRKNK